MFRKLIFVLVVFSTTAFAQTETLDNASIIELSRAGLSVDLILKKISTSPRQTFLVTADALVELKKAGVDDAVIALMMERGVSDLPTRPTTVPARFSPGYSDSNAKPEVKQSTNAPFAAKTIAFGKSSLQPSIKAVEKELMKRDDFRHLNLTILQYKEQADLFVDIGFVNGSIVTHRYTYHIYDRRSGAILAAGETTSWGSLAENLARHIAKRLTLAVQEGRLT